MSRNGPSAWGNANRNGPPAFGNPPSFPTYIASLLEMADSRPDSATTSPAIRGEEMSMHKTPLTELERDNYILAAEVRRLRKENERLADDMERCYRMLLSEPDVKGALFKAENILRESLADRSKK